MPFISNVFNLFGFIKVLSDDGRSAITRGIQEGRDGKGIIYVFAAGNEFNIGEDVNMEGWLNTRFTLIIGAVGKNGYHASYSTAGAAVFVSGPGGDLPDYFGNVMAATIGGRCVDATVGTSFAAPAVAGAIALILEVNPDLTWRDVQGILASTSQQVYPDDPSWVINGGGYAHSYKFGFGVVDAAKAAASASAWPTFGPEKQIMIRSGQIDIPIPDQNDSGEADNFTLTVEVADVINATGADTVIIESVVVYLSVNHSSRGDLKVVLVSPAGTESILSPGKM